MQFIDSIWNGYLKLVFVQQDVIEKGEKQPNLTIGILVSVVAVIITVLFKIIFGGKKVSLESL